MLNCKSFSFHQLICLSNLNLLECKVGRVAELRMLEVDVRLDGGHPSGPVRTLRTTEGLLAGMRHVMPPKVLLVVKLLATGGTGEVHVRVPGIDVRQLIEGNNSSIVFSSSTASSL